MCALQNVCITGDAKVRVDIATGTPTHAIARTFACGCGLVILVARAFALVLVLMLGCPAVRTPHHGTIYLSGGGSDVRRR